MISQNEYTCLKNIYMKYIFYKCTYVNKQWCAETNHQQATISCCSFFLPTSLVAAPFVNTSVTFLYPDKQSTFYSAARLVVDLLAVPFICLPCLFDSCLAVAVTRDTTQSLRVQMCLLQFCPVCHFQLPHPRSNTLLACV